MPGFSGRCWPGGRSIGWLPKRAAVERVDTLKLFDDDSPLAARKHDVMDTRSDRRTGNPRTLEVHRETGDGMGTVRADYHQGWSTTGRSQAGYRRAVRPELTISSTNLAPPGASI